jgi:hypothetical protein
MRVFRKREPLAPSKVYLCGVCNWSHSYRQDDLKSCLLVEDHMKMHPRGLPLQYIKSDESEIVKEMPEKPQFLDE